MMIRMSVSHDDAREAARELARSRWGDTKLRSAIATLRDRRDELGAGLRAELREIAGPEEGKRDER
jgi:hypothetical protein